MIEERVICELDGSWTEAEVKGVAKMLKTDIALELKTNMNFIDPFDYILTGYRTFTLLRGKLWLRSVKVSD